MENWANEKAVKEKKESMHQRERSSKIGSHFSPGINKDTVIAPLAFNHDRYQIGK